MLGAAVLSQPVSALEPRKSHAEMVRDAIDGHILPRLERLHETTAALAASLTAYCNGGDDNALRKRVEASLQSTVVAWGGIDFMRFGPSGEANRLERFFFWPDPRAVTERQVQALLARHDTALLEAGAFVKQSVAVQGLGALEFVLYYDKQPLDGAGEDAHYRCLYAAAVAGNLDKIAGELQTAWTAPEGWRKKMLTPGSDNAVYKDAGETARDVVKMVLTGLHMVQDRHVMPRLAAATADPPRRARVPFERSGLTAVYIEAEIHSIAALFDVLGIAAYVPPDKKWIGSFMHLNFKGLLADADALPRPEAGVALDEQAITRLRKMRFSLNGLRQVINRELAPAADLVLGFNELDGD